MRYVTYDEARKIHLEHFWARPESTNYQRWWSVPRRLAGRRPAKPKAIIALVQPRARLCPAHAHLGYTLEMYEAVCELNHRKNQACFFAWMVANDITQEDLAWVNLGSNEPILVKAFPRSAPVVSTERDERMKGLSRVLPPNAILWEVEQPQGVVRLKYLRDWFSQKMADSIQSACDAQFGPDQVVVS